MKIKKKNNKISFKKVTVLTVYPVIYKNTNIYIYMLHIISIE